MQFYLCLALVALAQAYYVPGTYPQEFKAGEQIQGMLAPQDRQICITPHFFPRRECSGTPHPPTHMLSSLQLL